MPCAPRELALAKAHLRSRPSSSTRASSRTPSALANAEPNARAALAKSPPDRCAEREFVEVAPKPTGHRRRRHHRLARPVPPRARGQGRLPRRRRLPRPRQRRRRHPRTRSTSAPNRPRTSTASRTRTAAPTPTTTATPCSTSTTGARTRPGQPGGDSPGCPKKNALVVVTAKEIRITQQIQFEFNKAAIKPGISFKILDAVVAGPQRQPQDQSRGPGPHRQRRQRRLQPEAVPVASRLGAGLPGRPRHRPGPPDLQGLRVEPAARPEHHRSEPSAEPPRPVHSDRVGACAGPAAMNLTQWG